MLVATCNQLFQIRNETRTIEIDDSIVRRYASDAEKDRESYTEVCDGCLSGPIISGRSGLSHPDESSSGSWNTESIHETSKHKFEDHGECCYSDKALALVFQFKVTDRLSA